MIRACHADRYGRVALPVGRPASRGGGPGVPGDRPRAWHLRASADDLCRARRRRSRPAAPVPGPGRGGAARSPAAPRRRGRSPAGDGGSGTGRASPRVRRLRRRWTDGPGDSHDRAATAGPGHRAICARTTWRRTRTLAAGDRASCRRGSNADHDGRLRNQQRARDRGGRPARDKRARHRSPPCGHLAGRSGCRRQPAARRQPLPRSAPNRRRRGLEVRPAAA